LYVGRDEAHAQLDAALHTSPGTVVVTAVHGMGGVGKSSLAAHWAAAHIADYSPIWWITADNPAAIDAGLAGLAVALQPTLSGALPEEALRERAVRWLATHDQWLLILDDVTDPAQIAPLLAQATTGQVLITSRRATGWHTIAAPIRLDALDAAEALEMLTRIVTHQGPRDLDGASELCAELGYLPLAIAQASAYLAETGVSPREYLRLLADYRATLYQQAPVGDDAAHTIARIWNATLDRLADDPLTGQVLRILAWYAPDSIPRSLLDGLTEPPALLRAIGRLAAYSMLTVGENTLTFHPLVQAVARTPDPSDPHRQPQTIEVARVRATTQLLDALPQDPVSQPAGWSVWRALLPHVDALVRHTEASGIHTADITFLLNQAGLFLLGQGSAIQAAAHFEQALGDSERILGPDHPHALHSRNNLAHAYQETGDLSRAIALFEGVLADRERVLGPDHPDTLASRNNLAHAYQETGDLSRAIALSEQALGDSERILGPDHPLTCKIRDNLAAVYEQSN